MGITRRQAYNLFRSLRKEIFPEWGIPKWAIRFYSLPFSEYPAEWQPLLREGGMAATLYDQTRKAKPATAIIIDGGLLPYMHEDEAEHILRHEIAHVIAGWDADHGPIWQEVAEALGTVALPYALLREWRSIPAELLDFDPVFLRKVNYQPTYG